VGTRKKKMGNAVYYRPINNDLLDAFVKIYREVAFWQTKEGLLSEFPDTKDAEIGSYDDAGIKQFCDEVGLPYTAVTVYK